MPEQRQYLREAEEGQTHGRTVILTEGPSVQTKTQRVHALFLFVFRDFTGFLFSNKTFFLILCSLGWCLKECAFCGPHGLCGALRLNVQVTDSVTGRKDWEFHVRRKRTTCLCGNSEYPHLCRPSMWCYIRVGSLLLANSPVNLTTHIVLQSGALGTLHMRPRDCYGAGSHVASLAEVQSPKGCCSFARFTLLCLLRSVNHIHLS